MSAWHRREPKHFFRRASLMDHLLRCDLRFMTIKSRASSKGKSWLTLMFGGSDVEYSPVPGSGRFQSFGQLRRVPGILDS